MVKANPFMTVISILLAALLGFWVSSAVVFNDCQLLAGIASGICFAATLIPIIGFNYESSRLGTNLRLLSTLFFIVFLISHFWFVKTGPAMPSYLVVNGIILLVFLGIFYKMQSIQGV